MYRAPTPRERERWHALWLLAQGWSAAQVADALERDAAHDRRLAGAFRRTGPAALALRSSGGAPPPSTPRSGPQLKAAVQAPPRAAGIDLADWNWKVVRAVRPAALRGRARPQQLPELPAPAGLRPQAPEEAPAQGGRGQARGLRARSTRAARRGARRPGRSIFFADEAHFYADADLRGKWVLKGQPALVDSTSPRWGEKASYYSAVCLETGEVAAMELAGNSTAETSAAFLRQLRAHHAEPLIVIWDNGPAHGGDALRAYLATPDLRLRLVRLPAYSPDFNADEAIWDWVREEVTANTCLGTGRQGAGARRPVLRRPGRPHRRGQARCRTALQARAEALDASPPHPTSASTYPCRSHLGFGLVPRGARAPVDGVRSGRMRHLRREGGARHAWTEAPGDRAERRGAGGAGAAGAGAHDGAAAGRARPHRAPGRGRAEDERGGARAWAWTSDTARQWRARWRPVRGVPLDELSVAARLADAPKPGAPARITPEQVCQIIALACELPAATGRPISQWSGRELADEVVRRGIVDRLSPRHAGRLLKSGRPAAAPDPVLAHARGRGPAGREDRRRVRGLPHRGRARRPAGSAP